MTALCGPCSEARMRWLDYRLPPAAPLLVVIGAGGVRDVAERRRARFEDWRRVIRQQQTLIAESCARGLHAGPGGEPSGSPSSSASAPHSSAPAWSCIELPAAPSSGSLPSGE